MNGPGRPTLYKTEYRELAHNYCLLGATNEALGNFFGVSRRTIDNWIAEYPEFAAAVHEGRAAADARVVRALYERAVGYRCETARTVLHDGGEKVLTNVVRYPPDTSACIFWLRNRQRQHWHERRQEPVDDGYDAIAALDAAGERARQARQARLNADP